MMRLDRRYRQEARRTAAKGLPNGSRHVLRSAEGAPMAGPPEGFRAVAVGVHPISALVSARLVVPRLIVLPQGTIGSMRYFDCAHVKVYQRGANGAGSAGARAINKTKGGLNTKIAAVVDALGSVESPGSFWPPEIVMTWRQSNHSSYSSKAN